MRTAPQPMFLRRLLLIAAASVLAVMATVVLPATAKAEAAPAAQAAPSALGFNDIRGDEWYVGAVYELADRGIVQGRQDGSFGPDESLTRAQMAAFLTRTLGLEESPGQPFLDVQPSAWYAGAVGALFQKGLIQGTSPIMFSPDRPISKQQAATLVMRSLAFMLANDPEAAAELDLTQDQVQAWLAGFRDRLLIAPAHLTSVANAYRLTLLDSPADGWFLPECNLTRAEMAVMLFRAFVQPILARDTLPEELPAVSTYESLSSGSEGTLVSFLEARLTALHYPCGPVDGVYDYRTKDAVMAFEKVERLSRNGRVNAEVWQRLLSAQTPTPRRSEAGTRCEVDLSRQVLMMITDNKVWKVIHVSSGKLGTRTGHFSIGAKYEGWVKCVTLDGEMYYPSYVVSRTAIHGYRSVPAYPASHGCVRVPVWTAVELYNQLPKGTTVDIYY